MNQMNHMIKYKIRSLLIGDTARIGTACGAFVCVTRSNNAL